MVDNYGLLITNKTSFNFFFSKNYIVLSHQRFLCKGYTADLIKYPRNCKLRQVLYLSENIVKIIKLML